MNCVAILQHTTCRDITERIIVGKVFPVPFHKKIDDILAEICPLVPSFTFTRVIHAPPSNHPHEYAYYSVSEKELQQLLNIHHLVGCSSPLTWQRLIRPNQIICSLCYEKGHTRSKCPHLLSGKRFCSNCSLDSHLARSCPDPCHCYLVAIWIMLFLNVLIINLNIKLYLHPSTTLTSHH